MRKSINQILKNFLMPRMVLLIFLAAYFLFSFLTYKDYGISFDERDVYLRGKLLYIKIKGNDPVLYKDFIINKGGDGGLRLYNHIYPAFLYIFNSKENYEIYHLLNLLFASLVFIAIYEILLYKYKNQFKALLGPIFLFFTPYFLGNIPINPKDMPFAVFYFLGLTSIILTQKWKTEFQSLALGLTFGLAASTRTIGYSIFIVWLIYRSLFLRKNLIDTLAKTAVIFIIAFFIQMLTMPYIAADPYNHFRDLLYISRFFPWKGEVLYMGRRFISTNLPWHYLLVWIGITTPLIILALFLIYLPLSLKDKTDALFSLAFIINLALYLYLKPVIYDGYRHFLFLAPIIVYLSASFFIKLLKKKNLRKWLFILATVNMFSIIYSYFTLHPYEYAYFNILTGGIKGAHRKFEIEYWNTATTEAVKWLKNYAKKNNKKFNVAVYGSGTAVEVYGKPYFNLTIPQKADIIITWERFKDHKKVKGKILHKIERQKVPLVYIFQTSKRDQTLK